MIKNILKLIKKLTLIGFLIFTGYMAWLIPQVIVALEMTKEAMEQNLGEPSSESIQQAGSHSGLAKEECWTECITEQELEYQEELARYHQIAGDIYYWSQKYGVDDVKLFFIAQCESGPNLENKCHTVSLDPYKEDCNQGAGIYKITPSTWKEALSRMGIVDGDVMDTSLNVQVAIFLMSQGEYWRWQKSEHCWGIGIPNEP